MGTGRVEAFSDGVIAIIVTIMVLQLNAPAEPTFASLLKISPVLLSYGLSFMVAAIMWVNHHHLLHAVREVNARLLWSNLNLLFWMSLIPFVTDYMGKNHKEPLPVALYGVDLTLCALAFVLLRTELARQYRHDIEMSTYHSRAQTKNFFSATLYALTVPLAYVSVYFSYAIFLLIPALYFLPEKRLAGGARTENSDTLG